MSFAMVAPSGDPSIYFADPDDLLPFQTVCSLEKP